MNNLWKDEHFDSFEDICIEELCQDDEIITYHPDDDVQKIDDNNSSDDFSKTYDEFFIGNEKFTVESYGEKYALFHEGMFVTEMDTPHDAYIYESAKTYLFKH